MALQNKALWQSTECFSYIDKLKMCLTRMCKSHVRLFNAHLRTRETESGLILKARKNKPKMSVYTRLTKYTNEYIYSKYQELVEPRLDEIQTWLYLGYSMEEMANELGIPNSLLWYMRFKSCIPALCDIFEQESMLIENVKHSLYRKAVGYYVTEETAIKVKTEYINGKGKKGTREEVKVVPLRKYISPDVQAIKFYLCNKDHKNWKENSQAGFQEETNAEVIDKADQILIAIKNKADEEGGN